MQVKLTQEFIQTQLRCPEDKPRIEFVDADCPGMYCLVSAVKSGVGTYFLRYKDRGGKTCHHKLGRTTDISLADARKAARTLRAEISLGQRDPRAEAKARKEIPLLSSYFRDTYLPHVKPRKRSWKRDEQLYRLYLDGKFGHKRLNEISRKEMIEHHAWLLNHGLSPASADHMAKLARRCLALAQDSQLIDANPLARFPLFNANNQVERLLDGEQLERLLEVLRTDSNRNVCCLAAYLVSTGARLGEALSATWSQIDLAHRVWKIPAVHSKSKRVRSVPLNDSAIAVLREVGTQGKFEHVFVNTKTKKPYVAVRKVWLRLCRKAGLPGLRLHDLRHQYASLLVNGGRSLYEVQQILGHSSPTVTARYAHLSTRSLQEAAGAASVIVKSAPPVPPPVQQSAAVAPPEAANAPTADDGSEAPQREPEAGQRAA